MFVCKLCEYEWEARVALPKQCPRCKRYDWNTERRQTALEGQKP